MFQSYIDTSALTNQNASKVTHTHTTFIEQKGSNYFLQSEFERKLIEWAERVSKLSPDSFIRI